MTENHYDIIIIGSGAGGGTLAHRLAPSGQKILILERGDFLPQEKENWDPEQVFLKNRYHTNEVWYDHNQRPLHPGTGYWVGGNTKVYGAALFRLRERDFEEVVHEGGISPAWPLKYPDFEPYYAEAEKLYDVHGIQGEDSTEPPRSGDYAYPPVSHEPRLQEIHDHLKASGYHPFHMPVGVKLNEANPLESPCIRCNTFDGFPCMLHAKADADINCIRPIMYRDNITLKTQAKVVKLLTNASGRVVIGVETEIENETVVFSANIIVVSCGAINSALLLLRSANEQHPNGLANSSDMVGRHLMMHKSDALLAISTKPNPTAFGKTMALNDFYWGEKEYPYPMGNVQTLGSVTKEMLKGDAPPLTPDIVLEQMASHAVGWWLMTEDLPDPDNRIRLHDEKIILEYTQNNQKSFNRLVDRWVAVLKSIDTEHTIMHLSAYFRKQIDIQGVGHQNGTCRFGPDSKTAVLDLNCKAHDLDNLYVIDGSFFPSCGAVNPSLTIMANALRVGDHLLERMK